MPHMVSPGKRNNVSANMRSFTCMSRSNESSELRNMPATISENGVTVPRLTPAKPLDDLYAVLGLGPHHLHESLVGPHYGQRPIGNKHTVRDMAQRAVNLS